MHFFLPLFLFFFILPNQVYAHLHSDKIKPDNGPELSFKTDVVLSGTITEESSGNPLQGATIYVEELEQGVSVCDNCLELENSSLDRPPYF